MKNNEKEKRNSGRLTDNEIGDEGVKTLSEMLKVNTTMTSLDLTRD